MKSGFNAPGRTGGDGYERMLCQNCGCRFKKEEGIKKLFGIILGPMHCPNCKSPAVIPDPDIHIEY